MIMKVEERKDKEIQGMGEKQPSTYPLGLAGKKKKGRKEEQRKWRRKEKEKIIQLKLFSLATSTNSVKAETGPGTWAPNDREGQVL